MKNISLFLFVILLSQNLQAQIAGFYDGKSKAAEVETARDEPVKMSNHAAVYLGLSNYMGDLGGNRGTGRKYFYDNNLKKRTFFYGISFTHVRKEAVGLRLSYTAGKIAGSDQDVEYNSTSDNAFTRYKRNLDFQTKISEGSLMLELYPLKFIRYTHAAHHWNLQPYALLGLGVYSFNPQGSYFDEIADDYVWVDLKPLRTEGQGMAEYPSKQQYKLTQANIPFGLGVNYNLTDKASIGFEFVGRKIFTDYLDDVSGTYIDPALFSKYMSADDAEIAKIINNKSNIIDPDNPYGPGEQRGNAQNKDFYYSINLKFSVRISKVKDVVSSTFKRKVYKYDDDEICN